MNEASQIVPAASSGLRSLEVAAGVPLRRSIGRRRIGRSQTTPLAALTQAAMPALLRPPCVVSFSGGRDSSLILATAVAAARREGLPLPVAVTIRFRNSSAADEREWQERTISHLGLDEWVCIEIENEFDCVGPIAQQILLRHGVLWPANTHFHVPQLEHAAGGSLLTGVGGDEIFSPSGWARLRQVLGGGAVPEPRDALRLAGALSPHAVRRRIIVARSELGFEWLRPTARREVVAALAVDAAAEPLTWRRRVGWVMGLGYVQLGTASLALVASDYRVQVSNPFLDPGFVAAIASLPREGRFEDRTTALTTLFDRVLAPETLARRTKAAFGDALWGAASQTLVASWNGDAVDVDLVDPEALGKRWHDDGAEGPHTLLQSIWLRRAQGSSRDGVEQQVNGGG